MNEDIYKRLKKIVFTMTILIVAALILLIVLLVKKKTLNNTLPLEVENINNVFKTIEIKEAFPYPNCEPIEVIFKENYIGLYSKSCKIIKLLKVR